MNLNLYVFRKTFMRLVQIGDDKWSVYIDVEKISFIGHYTYLNGICSFKIKLDYDNYYKFDASIKSTYLKSFTEEKLLQFVEELKNKLSKISSNSYITQLKAPDPIILSVHPVAN